MCGNAHGVRSTAALLARSARATVVVPDYRLAPEHTYPGAHEDAVTVCRWVLSELGATPDKFALVGDSAGGGLALAAAVALRESDGGVPGAIVGWSPWVDLEVSGSTVATNDGLDPIASGQSLKMCAEAYLQGHDARDPGVSPLHADLTGLPPMLLEVGTVEVLLDDSRRLSDAARSAGVEVTLEEAEGLPHVYQYFASFLPAARSSIERSGAFIAKHTA
jgi:acetyl esterase/lipase